MKNKNTFVHIGMPKTATTTLQTEIFPRLCGYTKFNYWQDDIILRDKIRIHTFKLVKALPVKPIVMSPNSLISLESLIGVDPKYWEEISNSNKIIFGENSHILILLRDPKSYLESIYTEICLHSGRMQLPEHFFVKRSEHSDRHAAPVFCIEDFDYNNLIGYYRKNFKTVTIVKFHKLPQLEFINDFFDISKSQHNYLKGVFNRKTHNKRISHNMAKLLFFINKALNQFGMSLGIRPNNSSISLLRESKFTQQKQNILKLVLKKFLRKFNLIGILRLIGNLLKMRKFEVDFDKLNYIDLDKLDKIYENIPDYITYKR